MKIKNFTTLSLVLLLVLGFSSCSSDSSDDPLEVTVTTSDFTTTIDENPNNGQVIGTVTGTTNQGGVTFSIIEQTPSGAFAIDSNTGELTVADDSLFDFETNPTITGVVKVANGSVIENAIVTIYLNDIDEANIFYGNVILLTQEDVDDFGANNYTDILGYLSIGNYDIFNSSIHDLSTLSTIRYVESNLQIMKNNILTSLEGLHNISEVGHSVHIYYNISLINLDQLSGLLEINHRLNIGANFKLVNIDGLQNIISVGENLQIYNNIKLLTLNGFQNLASVIERVDITSNTELYDLCGLQTLIGDEGIDIYVVSGNAYNPTQQDILNGNCSL